MRGTTAPNLPSNAVHLRPPTAKETLSAGCGFASIARTKGLTAHEGRICRQLVAVFAAAPLRVAVVGAAVVGVANDSSERDDD